MRDTRKQSFDYALSDEGSGLYTYRSEIRRYGIKPSVVAVHLGECLWSDIRELDEGAARSLYDLVYWQHAGCLDLSRGLDYFVFDTGLVFEPATAFRWIEQITGELGRRAAEALNDLGIEAALRGVEFYRRRRLRVDPLWPVLGVEWSNRCNRAKTRALKMANAKVLETA